MEIVITEAKSETLLRRLRVAIVNGIARLCRVPIAIRSEFRGAPPVGTTSDSA